MHHSVRASAHCSWVWHKSELSMYRRGYSTRDKHHQPFASSDATDGRLWPVFRWVVANSIDAHQYGDLRIDDFLLLCQNDHCRIILVLTQSKLEHRIPTCHWAVTMLWNDRGEGTIHLWPDTEHFRYHASPNDWFGWVFSYGHWEGLFYDDLWQSF